LLPYAAARVIAFTMTVGEPEVISRPRWLAAPSPSWA
jgi:hypothetical protein